MLPRIASLIIISVTIVLGKDLLSRYDSCTTIDTKTAMHDYYVGNLYASGGAVIDSSILTNEKKQIATIGKILPQKIILFGDDSISNEVFSFNKVNYYRVKKGNKNFVVMLIKASIDNVNYEILIENKSDNMKKYHRVMNIYKEGNPYIMILWVDRKVVDRFIASKKI